MVTITVSAAGPVPLARGLPITLNIPGKQLETATVADVKAALAQKYPKVKYSLKIVVLRRIH